MSRLVFKESATQRIIFIFINITLDKTLKKLVRQLSRFKRLWPKVYIGHDFIYMKHVASTAKSMALED